jgi:hypothetical protein
VSCSGWRETDHSPGGSHPTRIRVGSEFESSALPNWSHWARRLSVDSGRFDHKHVYAVSINVGVGPCRDKIGTLAASEQQIMR